MSDALIIQVDSSQVEKGKKSLADLAAQGAKTEKSVSNFGDVYDRQGRKITESAIRQAKALDDNRRALEANKRSIFDISSAASALAGQLTPLTAGLVGVAGALKAIQTIDAFTKFNAQLKLATRSQEEFLKATGDVSAISKVAQADISAIGTLYARINNAVRGLGASQKETADITENVALALKTSGATAAETSSAVLQLSQAFGSGVLRGEEFNAVNEAAPALMRALAESIGVPVGELRELASNGEITGQVLLKAFGDDTLLENFREQAKEVQTISGGWKVFTNQLTLAIGKINETTGASRILIGVLENAATLLSVFQGGEKNSILRNFLDTGVSARQKQLSGFNISQLKGLSNFQADAKQELEKRLKAAQPIFGGVVAQSIISPNFSAGIEAQDINKIHAAQEEKLKSIKSATDRLRKSEEDRAKNILKSIELIKLENSLLTQGVPLQDAKTIAQLKLNGATDAMIVSTLNATAANEKLISTFKLEEEFYDNFEKSIVSQAEALDAQIDAINASARALEDENATFGKLPSAITDVTIARKQDKKAILESIGLVVPELEAEIEAYKKLKAAQFTQEDLERNKKIQDEIISSAKKTAEEIAKDAKQTSDSIYNSISDSIVRSLENGKGSFKTFYKSLVNSAKASVIRFGVDFFLQGSGLKGILATLAGLFSNTASANSGISSLFGGSGVKDITSVLNNGFSGIKDVFSSGNSLLTSGIENLGTLFATGNGGIADAIGGFLGANAGAISSALPYAGAVLQLAQGNFAGAAFTAAGAAIGGPIGAAIGSVVGSLFGSKKKIPRFSSQILGEYDNGTFTSKSGVQQYKPLGAEKQLAGLSEQFALTLGSFLKGFALDDAIKIQADLIQKRKKSYGLFSATFDGGSVSSTEVGKAKNTQKTFEALVENVLGPTIVQAIQKTDVDQAIKDLFRVDEKKEQVVNLINASVSLQNSQKELAERFGLTVGKAAEVSKATGKVGDALATFVANLASAALAFKSPAQALLDVRDSFGATLNNALGTVITTAVTEQVAVAQPVAPKPTALQTLFGSNGNNGFSLGSIVTAGLNQASTAIKSATQTVYESVTKYVETILPASVKLPASLAEFDTLLKDIDKSTAAGVKQFADLFGIRDQFAAYQAAVDSLKTGVQGSIFALSSEAEQEAFKVKALSDAFASLGLAAPTSREELIKLAQGLDYSTKSGLELANALPSLTTAWLDIKDNATNAADAIKQSFQELFAATKTDNFKTYIDYIGYLATGKARGKEAANNEYFTQDYANTVASNNQNQFAQANAEKQAAKKDQEKTTQDDMLKTVQTFGLDIKDDLKSIVKTLAIIQNDGLKVANA